MFKAKCQVHLPLELLDELNFQVANTLLSRKQSNCSYFRFYWQENPINISTGNKGTTALCKHSHSPSIAIVGPEHYSHSWHSS